MMSFRANLNQQFYLLLAVAVGALSFASTVFANSVGLELGQNQTPSCQDVGVLPKEVKTGWFIKSDRFPLDSQEGDQESAQGFTGPLVGLNEFKDAVAGNGSLKHQLRIFLDSLIEKGPSQNTERSALIDAVSDYQEKYKDVVFQYEALKQAVEGHGLTFTLDLGPVHSMDDVPYSGNGYNGHKKAEEVRLSFGLVYFDTANQISTALPTLWLPTTNLPDDDFEVEHLKYSDLEHSSERRDYKYSYHPKENDDLGGVYNGLRADRSSPEKKPRAIRSIVDDIIDAKSVELIEYGKAYIESEGNIFLGVYFNAQNGTALEQELDPGCVENKDEDKLSPPHDWNPGPWTPSGDSQLSDDGVYIPDYQVKPFWFLEPAEASH